MKNKYSYSVICILISILFQFCSNPKKPFDLSYYENGKIKKEVIYITNLKRKEINFFQNGEIKSILTFNDSLLEGEQFWFFENGRLNQKINFSDNIKNDNAYFFYTDGRLKNDRYFRNGKEVLFGSDYWDDSVLIIKSTLHFNDSGEIYLKKNFDQSGRFLNEEKSSGNISK